LAQSKIKVGDKVKFNFAGSEYEGRLVEIKDVPWGSISHTWYMLEGQDGTIYPLKKEKLNKVND
jgi:predicted lysophospholipase L1 biosynthesis ABC-type transport system permease subunit